MMSQILLISSLIPKIQLIATGWYAIWPLQPHSKIPHGSLFHVPSGFSWFKTSLKQRIWLVDHMETKNIIMHFNRPRSKWKDRHSWLIERSENGLLLYVTVPVHLLSVTRYWKSYDWNIWWIVLFEAFGLSALLKIHVVSLKKSELSEIYLR